MNSFEPQQYKIGILGGGQLGRMLIQNAINYNLNIFVLDPDANAPCKGISNFKKGSITDYETVYNFGKDKDVITIEIENVNIEALEAFEKNLKTHPNRRNGLNGIMTATKQSGNNKK